MQPTRSRFHQLRWRHPEHLQVEVIGLYVAHDEVYHTPGGLPSWRIMMFHAPMTVQVTSATFYIAAHTLFVFPPSRRTTYGTSGRTWSHSWIRLSGNAVPRLLADAGIPHEQPICFEDSRESDKWLGLLHDELNHPRGVDESCVERVLDAWIHQIRRRLRPGDECPVPSPFRQIREHIETHYLEPLTLGDLAERACVSRQHLCTMFGRHYGIAPIELAIQLRMQHAAELLVNVDFRVSDVAHATGYDDVCYFSRLFKKHMHSSPRQYRQQRAFAER